MEPKPAKVYVSKEALDFIRKRADGVKVIKVEKPKPKPKEKP